MEYIKYKLLQSYLGEQTLTPDIFDVNHNYFHFIIGTSNDVTGSNPADVLIGADEFESDTDYKNYFYCIGTVIGTSANATVDVSGDWQQFNKSIAVPIGTSYKTYVYIVGFNEDMYDDEQESLNFTVIGSTNITNLKNNIHKCVSVAGHYGSLVYGSNYLKYGQVPHCTKPTFQNTKIGSCSDLKLFNYVTGVDSNDPYSELFKGSYIANTPTFGTYVDSDITLGEQPVTFIKQQLAGRGMFQNCNNLTQVTIPMVYVESDSGHSTTVDDWMINYWSTFDFGNLWNYNSAITDDVRAFKGCSKLSTIDVNMYNSLNHMSQSEMEDFMNMDGNWLGTCVWQIIDDIASDTGLSVGSSKKLNLKNAPPVTSQSMSYNGSASSLRTFYSQIRAWLQEKGWDLYVNGSQFTY